MVSNTVTFVSIVQGTDTILLLSFIAVLVLA